MKTEQIIKTLNHWTPCLLTSKEEELAINAAIERLQELELTVARYERFFDVEANAKVEQEYRKEIRQLARERDEARREAKTVRGFLDAGMHPVFPWEVESK